jgi:hypothetical protein
MIVIEHFIRLAKILMSCSALVLALAMLSPPVFGQSSTTFCLRQYEEQVSQRGNALGISPPDAELLIERVADSISLNIDGITIVPCDQASKAQSTYADGSVPGVPAGEYILYDPSWLREVIGNDKTQAIAIFGHELGHLLNRDFYKPRSLLPRIRLETDADGFAGCAVARLGGSWGGLENLLTRIRRDVDTTYPSAKHSIAAARQGFATCGGDLQRLKKPANAPTIPIADSGWVDGGSSPGAFCKPLLFQYQQKYPDFEIALQELPEEHHRDWKGHVTYHYRCAFTASPK